MKDESPCAQRYLKLLKHTFDLIITSEPGRCLLRVMVKMEWLRDDDKFIVVFATVRLARPKNGNIQSVQRKKKKTAGSS